MRLKYLFAGVVAIGAAACTPKTVMPELGRVVVDTTFRAGPMNLAVQYDFASILNAADVPALEAIEQANIESFFGLEAFARSTGWPRRRPQRPISTALRSMPM